MPAEVEADPDALKVWNRLVPQLEGAGVLTPLDGDALSHYCMLHAFRDRAHAALVAMRAEDPYYEQSRDGQTAVKMVMDLGKSMRATEAEFGMTPSGRARIVVPSDRTKDADKAKTAKTARDFICRAG